MKLSNMQIELLLEDLKGVSKKDLPFSVAWSMRKNIKKLEDIHELVLKERMKIEMKYVEDGHVENNIVLEEYRQEFNEKLNDLYRQENELEFIKLNPDALSEVSLSLEECRALEAIGLE